MSTARAARLYAVLTAGVVAFHLAVAAGAPWGHLTQGGQYTGTLPASRRTVAVISALVMVGTAAIVGSRAGLWLPSWRRHARPGAWVVVAFLALGVVLNTITPSAAERALWLPVTLAMTVAALVVARTPP